MSLSVAVSPKGVTHDTVSGVPHCQCRSQTQWCCWAQSVDLRDPWIALGSPCAIIVSMDPYVFVQESVDRAVRSMNFAYHAVCNSWRRHYYMDRLVIFTNLTFYYSTHFKFNGPLQYTEQNHRPSASIVQGHKVVACAIYRFFATTLH